MSPLAAPWSRALVVHVGHHRLVAPLSWLHGVRPLRGFTRVPGAPAGFLGLFRAPALLPLLDPVRVLALDGVALPDLGFAVLVGEQSAELAVPVSRTAGMIDCAEAELTPREGLRHTHGADAEGRIHLDLRSLLAAPELRVAAGDAS